MYTYALLEPGCYYLLQEAADSSLRILKVAVETDLCLYVTTYDETVSSCWKKKTDPIHDIIECLSDEKVKEWESAFKEGWDAYYEEEDDE